MATTTPAPAVRIILSPTPTARPGTPTPVTRVREQAHVSRVLDVGTVEVSLAGKTFKVRYIGVDVPRSLDQTRPVRELDAAGTAANAELVRGKPVILERDVTDVDGRGSLPRYVFVGDVFVNAELIRRGYATTSADRPDLKYQETFQKLEAEARESRRGFWARSAPNPPAADGATLPQGLWKQEYEAVDMREVAVNPERFRNRKARLIGLVADAALDPDGTGDYVIWFRAAYSDGGDGAEPVIVRYHGELPRLYKNTPAKAFGTFAGRAPASYTLPGARFAPPVFLADAVEY